MQRIYPSTELYVRLTSKIETRLKGIFLLFYQTLKLFFELIGGVNVQYEVENRIIYNGPFCGTDDSFYFALDKATYFTVMTLGVDKIEVVIPDSAAISNVQADDGSGTLIYAWPGHKVTITGLTKPEVK